MFELVSMANAIIFKGEATEERNVSIDSNILEERIKLQEFMKIMEQILALQEHKPEFIKQFFM